MEPLLLLHGAIGAARQLVPLAEQLKTNYKIYTPDFTGHGGRPASGHFSMQLFAEDVIALMDKEGLQKASVFGFSLGGYVGMYMARHYPERINKLVTLATKYHWDPASAAKEMGMLNADTIEQKIPVFAETLRERHAPSDWREVLKKTADMISALGTDNTLKQADHAAILAPTLLLLGDRDKMISLEETLAVYRSIPNAQLGMLPNTQHPIEQVDVELLGMMIRKFLG